MKWCASLLLTSVVIVIAASDSAAQLQLFGPKKAKVPAQQRVPELIGILKFEKDAPKRADAAEELRQFEPKDFPEIVPVLLDSLQHDPATNVRIEAATSLGRLRPINVQVGQLLEKSASSDANLRVRLQAEASLMYYRLSGYKPNAKADTPVAEQKARSDEPPLAGAPVMPKAVLVSPATPVVIQRPMPTGPTANPQVPVITAPPAHPQTAAPSIQPTPTPLPQQAPTQPPPQWAPPLEEGPNLAPPE